MGQKIITVMTSMLALLFLLPLVLFFLNTFKDEHHIFDTFYMPNLLYFDNYSRMFKTSDFLPSLGLTILICFFTPWVVAVK